jgi:sugar fermentation stimulation protein A
MILDPPLTEAVLLRRYKRFFADVRLADGSEATAHCPNPGSMLGLVREGAGCWLSRSDNPKRKLALTLELVETDGGLVCVNTHRANALAFEALAAGRVPGLEAYKAIRPEAAYGERSRVDFLLEGEGLAPTYVEVKSVTLSRTSGLAEFPDSRSERALKHMGELVGVTRTGARAVVLFMIQRGDCTKFAPAADIDPAFARALAEAEAAGVEVRVMTAAWSAHGAEARALASLG